eukprot:10517822-Heterocapsa_arctica.AAC.1
MQFSDIHTVRAHQPTGRGKGHGHGSRGKGHGHGAYSATPAAPTDYHDPEKGHFANYPYEAENYQYEAENY